MHYPTLLQKTNYDCGPTCIYMLCQFYNLTYDESKILFATNTTALGTSVWNMIQALSTLGFTSSAISITSLRDYTFSPPTIAIVKNNSLYHYVVIYKRNPNYLIIGDPLHGLCKVSNSLFELTFTGILIVPVHKF